MLLNSPIRFNLMMKGEVEATTLKEPYITLTKKKGWRTICSALYHGTGVASDKADTETYKAFNRALCEAVRRIKPMFVYEAMSRRPISTNMLAKTGSRKRSEMRVAR